MTVFTAMKVKRHLGCGILICILLICTLGINSPPGRTAVRTALLILHILPGLPVSPLELGTQPPLKEQVSYAVGETYRAADLYRPRDADPHSALIFSLGLHPNYTDAFLVSLAEGLAREGIVVMIPRSAHLEQNRLAPEDIDALVAAFENLRQKDFVDSGRVGFAGFCIGSSLATVAAEDERIASDVAFLHLFGGYYDLRDLVRAIVTETVFEDNALAPWEPTELVFTVLAQHLIDGLEEPKDRTVLADLFSENSQRTYTVNDLSPQGKAVYGVLTSQDPVEVATLLDHLPPKTLQLSERLSPSNNSGRLQAKVFVISDVSDPNIPAVETRRLANSISTGAQVDYTEFILFEHVRPTRPIGRLSFLKEVGKLYFHLYRVLAELER